MKKTFSYFLKSFLTLSSVFFILQTSVHAQSETWATCTSDGIPTLSCLDVVAGNLITMSSILIVLVLFVMFVVGSLSYLTSGGDHEKVHKAQQTLMFALIGTILFVSAFLIIKVIDTLFLGGTGQLLHFSIELPTQ